MEASEIEPLEDIYAMLVEIVLIATKLYQKTGNKIYFNYAKEIGKNAKEIKGRIGK